MRISEYQTGSETDLGFRQPTPVAPLSTLDLSQHCNKDDEDES